MKFRKLAIAAVAVCLPLAATACGGSDDNNSGDRPSASEISKAFAAQLPSTGADASVTDAVADCFGKKVYDSDIPNGVLRAVVAGDEAEVDKDNEDKYTKIITDAGVACATEAAGAGATDTTAAP